jgi:hypothetical protein
MGRFLVAAGVVLIIAGAVVMLIESATGARGLPGDITYRRGNFIVFFPVASSIVISLVLSVLLYLLFGHRR